MISYTAPFVDIEYELMSRGIPLNSPGFYDHPNFIEAEKRDSRYLNNYARYVHDRPLDPKYSDHVRKTVPIVARIFHSHLRSHGREGACVDISALLSPALEREGIWNFLIKGSLTIEFPEKAKICKKYFWSVDFGKFVAGHAWVAAPPFYIVDLTIQLQPYLDGEEQYLPAIVCAEADELAEGTLEDIVSPQVRDYLSYNGIPEDRQLHEAGGEATNFMKVFPARQIRLGGSRMKYIPTAATAPDTPFEEMDAMLFRGKTGYDLYNKEVKAALAHSNIP